MKSSWRAISFGTEEDGARTLLNGHGTKIRFSRRVVPEGVNELLDAMRKARVPFSYTHGITEIYFTVLPGTHGDYDDSNGRVRISCGAGSREIWPKILVHELAHHVDEIEGISKTEAIGKEKRKRGKHMPSDAFQNKAEYVALGFEVFYFGTREERRAMRKGSPELWSAIKAVHEARKTLGKNTD